MKKIATLFFVMLCSFSMVYAVEGGILTPNSLVPNQSVTINYDGTGTNFADWTPQCFIHVWLIPKVGEVFSINYTPDWLDCNSDEAYALIDSKFKMTYSGTPGRYSITIPNLYTYFNVLEQDKPKVGKFGIVVRSQYSGENNQTINFYVDVEEPGEIPPVITPALGVTVDAPFDVNYTDDGVWNSSISEVIVGEETLDFAAYDITVPGKISFIPSASALLTAPGLKKIAVLANGYSKSEFFQPIGVGATTKLAITTQPTAPVSNGTTLVVQPVVITQDQYGNLTSSTVNIVAEKGDPGAWSLGGTTTVTANAGTATFTNLTASCITDEGGATITFSSEGLTSVTSEPFTVPAINLIDWVNVQWPANGTISLGSVFNVYAWVYEPTVTNLVGKGDGFRVWIGYNTQDTDPGMWTNWLLANYDSDQNGISNDQYVANIGSVITSVGTYYYASRVQLGSAPYQYGGVSGGFWDNINNKSGILTVGTVTGTEKNSVNDTKIWAEGRTINAQFEGTAQVELFNSVGQLIHSSKATNLFSETVNTGLYVLKLNGKTYKVFAK